MEALESLAAQIQAKHPAIKVECRALNVNETSHVRAIIRSLNEALDGLNIVIANAGIAANGRIGTGKLASDLAIIQTNVMGAMATIDAAVEIFKEQESGHVVGISSVAGFRGLPGSGAYSASKAAIATYLDALSTELHNSTIKVTTLFPGFIDTPLNNMISNRLFLIDVERGAKIMADLIEKQVESSTVPVYPWNLVGKLLKNLPRALLAKQSPL